MSKLRLVAVAAAAAASVVTGATPSDAVAQYETVVERVVTASGQLEGANKPSVSITASLIDSVGGGLAAPTVSTSSTACLTVDPPGTEQATKTSCGPASVEVSPTLGRARVSGVVDGVSFVVDVVADSTPSVSAEPPAATSSSVTVSRVGTAMATMVGGAIGDTEAQGSSWYAEVREKAKTTATPQ